MMFTAGSRSDCPDPLEYARGLAAYRAAVASFGSDATAERCEYQFESLKDWSLFASVEQTRAWFLDRRSANGMQVEEIPLRNVRGWIADPDTGDIRHDSGDFFTVRGIRVSESSSREVGNQGWDQPILEQVGLDGGLLGIVRRRFSGVPHYLIEAKAEPGNYEIVQLSPTLQATFANLRKAHGGRKPRFAEIFENPQQVGGDILYGQWLSEDGGRLHRKRNYGMLVEVPSDVPLDTTENFCWMSLYQIKSHLQENAWVNPHIRGIIAHM